MKKPFLLNFKRKLEPLDFEIDLIQYNEEKQVNDILTSDPVLMWKVWYTSVHTPSKYIPGHRARSNKWIPGHTRKAKKDRRQNR